MSQLYCFLKTQSPICVTTDANFKCSLPSALGSFPTSNLSISENISVSPANISTCGLVIGPRDKVLCCAQAVHKNKNMEMMNHQELLHKLIFERRGMLPDRTIVSILYAKCIYSMHNMPLRSVRANTNIFK